MALQLGHPSETAVVSSKQAASRNPVCHITYTRDTWVQLLQAPSDYAAAEAKLLCPTSNDTWVVWVPDYGETVLNRSEFYC